MGRSGREFRAASDRELRWFAAAATGSLTGVTRGRVAAAGPDGRVTVTLGDGRRVECAVICVADGAVLTLFADDEVLIHCGDDANASVVLGRIGPSHASALEAVLEHAESGASPEGSRVRAADPQVVPDELVLEAKESLTLRVGDGSITLRADGKVTIKGKDLVSHAQRLNRIKGGAVSIN